MGATAEEIAQAFQKAIKKSNIPQLPIFKPANDLEIDGERIIELITSFENQCTDLGITDAAEKKRLLLLRQPVLSDINVNIPDSAGNGDAYQKIKQKILSYYYCHDLKATSKRRLSTVKQKKTESFNDFVKNVRRIATLAEVNDNTVLRDTIVRGMKDDEIGEKIKREHFINEKDLDTLIKDTNNLVFACKQVSVLKEEKVAHVKKTTTHFQQQPQKRSTFKRHNHKLCNKNECIFCGASRKHQSRNECPAFGKECRICKKKNHFAKVCMSKDKRNSDQAERKPIKKVNYRARRVQEEDGASKVVESEDDDIVSSMVNHMTIH